MIRRDAGTDWLLIAQPHHAHLAAEIAQAWGQLPLPDLLIDAVRDHDEGWHGWELSPEVDPASGIPRDFTEMPMPTATRIWSESIAAAAAGEPSRAEALDRFERLLHARKSRLTPGRAAILEAVLTCRGPFSQEELLELLEGTHSRATVYRTVSLLVEAGVLRLQKREGSRDEFELALARIGSSPLGGIWVSRHFCYLAEKAKENRGGELDELAALDRFLSEQARLQESWTGAALREFAGDELPRLIETGFRYVQFFDRISLWLCCAERAEAADMTLPGGGTYRFTPRTPDTIAIAPYPLSAASLQLSVTARRIPARRYDDEQLRQTIAAAPTERLIWTLIT